MHGDWPHPRLSPTPEQQICWQFVHPNCVQLPPQVHGGLRGAKWVSATGGRSRGRGVWSDALGHGQRRPDGNCNTNCGNNMSLRGSLGNLNERPGWDALPTRTARNPHLAFLAVTWEGCTSLSQKNLPDRHVSTSTLEDPIHVVGPTLPSTRHVRGWDFPQKWVTFSTLRLHSQAMWQWGLPQQKLLTRVYRFLESGRDTNLQLRWRLLMRWRATLPHRKCNWSSLPQPCPTPRRQRPTSRERVLNTSLTFSICTLKRTFTLALDI